MARTLCLASSRFFVHGTEILALANRLIPKSDANVMHGELIFIIALGARLGCD
jgi:hypothetical protein